LALPSALAVALVLAFDLAATTRYSEASEAAEKVVLLKGTASQAAEKRA
jgi:hypothetical protein